MSLPLFALVDCNNFYVSCERVFNPKLIGKPVVVLSNNDGCAISRSNEAKAVGIPMGAPYFKFKDLSAKHDVAVLSSNYRLYGDMSNRVMTLLKTYFPEVEVYSIDEAFIGLDKLSDLDIKNYTYDSIHNKVSQATGIPLTVGIGPTKTLAKIANYIAKSNRLKIFDISDPNIRVRALCRLSVNEIWGISKGISERLKKLGITTAGALMNADPKLIRKVLGVIGERIVLELKGVSCLELKSLQDPKKSITTSRSFSAPLAQIEKLEEALSHYCSIACSKLRAARRKAQGICAFITTSYHTPDQEFYKNSSSLYFDLATDDTISLIKAAKSCLKQIYRPGLRYKKVGIILLDLIDNSYAQGSLLSCSLKAERASNLMMTIDNINRKMGKGTLFIAAEGITKSWQMQSSWRSLNFTSCWNELIVAG